MVNKKYMPRITTVSDDKEKVIITMKILDKNANLKKVKKSIKQAYKSLQRIWHIK